MGRTGIIGFDRLSELEDFLAGYSGRVGFLAGGTDLVLGFRGSPPGDRLFIDISRVRELDFIQENEDRVVIGAATTMDRIAASRIIRDQALGLAQAAGTMGSAQIRNLATLGGNIATGSPAADTLPPLTALGARGRVLKRGGGEIKYADHLVIDVCGTQLSPQDLIVTVGFPIPQATRVSGFVKIGARTSLTIAKLSLALVAEVEGDRIIRGRVALGALGELPVCPDNLEFFLENREIDEALGTDLAERLVEVIDGAIPDRASRPYKRSAVRGAALDLVEMVFGPGGKGGFGHAG